MGVAAQELESKYEKANHRFRRAFQALLAIEGWDLKSNPTTSFQFNFGFSPNSEPSIPNPIKRLVNSAYTQHLPISTIRALLFKV